MPALIYHPRRGGKRTIMSSYQQQAYRTASCDYDKVAERYQKQTQKENSFLFRFIQFVISAGIEGNIIKRDLFYGKPPNEETPIEFAEKQRLFGSIRKLTARSLEGDQRALELLHAMLGIASELSELLEGALPYLLEGEPLDEVNVIEELGDIRWYQALGASAIEADLSNIDQINIEKLRRRYPEKFTEHNAIERDLDAERGVLEESCGKENSLMTGAISDWLLISKEDVADIADGLIAIADNDHLLFEIRELASSLLHTLDTGTHCTNAVPKDFEVKEESNAASS